MDTGEYLRAGIHCDEHQHNGTNACKDLKPEELKPVCSHYRFTEKLQ